MTKRNALAWLRHTRLIAFAIALMAIALACGPGEEPAGSDGIAVPTSTAMPAPVAPEAKRGGILRTYSVSNGCGKPTLQMDQQTCVRGMTLMAPMFSNLVRYDVKNYTKLMPDLATGWKFVAPNKYVFEIRTDAKWTDGTPVTPKDVVYTLERAVEKNINRVGRQLIPIWGGAEVTGTNEVTLTNDPLSAMFLGELGTNHMKIYSEKVLSALPEDSPLMTRDTIVSSGPFKFKQWNDDEFFELERHDDYVTSAADGDLPYLDGVKTFIIKDTSAQMAAFQAGQLDIIPRFPILSPSQVKIIQDFFGDRVNTVRTPDSTPIRVSSVNVTRPPLDDPRVIKALWVSLDRPSLQKLVFEGLLTPGAILDPKVFPDAALSLEELAEFPGLLEPDYELAKSLLADAGFPNGLEIPETITRNIGSYTDLAQIMIEGWKKAGITFGSHTLATSLSSRTRTKDGDFHMVTVVRAGYTVPAPLSPFTLIYSDAVRSEYASKDPSLEALITEARTTLDESQRNAMIKDIQRKIFTDMTFSEPTIGVADVLLPSRSYVKDFARSVTLFEEHRYDVMWFDQ